MIAIIDYNAGNVASVQNALEQIGVKSVVTSNHAEIRKAEKVIFPGVGRAGAAMEELRKRGLDKLIPTLKQPFLGICLGLQLLAGYSEEDDTKCLGIISGRVMKFPNSVKIPQIGWNKVSQCDDLCWCKSKSNMNLFKDVLDEAYFYFVNSFALEYLPEQTIGKTSYGIDFASAVQKDNFFGAQFHPEKSGEVGLKVLRNFVEYQPSS